MKYLYSVFLFLCAGAILAPYLSVYYFPFFQFLSLGLFAFLLVLVPAFFFIKKENKKIRWLTLAFILLVIISLRKEVSFSSPSNSKKDFSVLSYNVQCFGYDKEKKEEVLTYIKSKEADFVCLQEFLDFRKNPHTTHISLRETAQKLGMPYAVFPSGTTHIIGVAFFSKYPIVKIDTLFMDKTEPNSGILVTVQTPKGKLGVGCLHLSSFCFSALRKHIPDKVDYLIAAWKRWKKILDLQQQKVDKIKNITQKYPYPYVLAGDFNANPEGRIAAQFSENLSEAFQEKGQGLAWTYPLTRFLGIKIDHQFHTSDLKVLECQVLKKNFSDHYPILAKYQYYTNKK